MIAVFGIVVAVNYIARSVPVAADFTENKVHTLSEGTRRILEKIDTPVSIKYYVTQDADVMPSFLLTRSREFEAFLRQYVRASDGNVTIEKYDPEPDTDEEDAARLEGVQANQGPKGEVYFGCAIKSLDQKVILPYIPAISDELQEYEMTRAISQVASGSKTVVGVMSSFEVAGGLGGGNPMMGARPEPAWVFYEQLGQDYEVEVIGQDVEVIPESVSVLVLLHAAELTESALFAVDQYLLGGGKLAVFLDPLSITARMQTPAPNPMQRNQPPAGPATSSNLERLLSNWGYKFNSSQIVADINYKTPLQGGVQAPGVLTFPPDALNRDDVLTSKLSDMLMLFAGEFTGEPVDGLVKEVLVSSSTASQNVDSAGVENDHERIQREFKPSGEEKVLALRLSGTFETAFPEGKPGGDEEPGDEEQAEGDEATEATAGETDVFLKKSEKEGAVVLVGDTDFLYDQFCVRIMPMMGQRLMSMQNGNLPLFLN
ncbi:MAG: GldG family protein, partial [Verrucomicrobiales bacterium]|nr:GldG family protein [Verrucomicrobiales bacterium]